MSDALEEHDVKVGISSRNVINLQFAYDIDAVAEEEKEQEAQDESLNKTCTRYKIEISAETRMMTNIERDQGKRAEAGNHNKL